MSAVENADGRARENRGASGQFEVRKKERVLLLARRGFACSAGCWASPSELWLALIGKASFHLGKRNAEAFNSLSQTVGVLEGSVVVGELEGASVGGARVGVSGGSSAGGTVGLGAGRGAFLRFTVFFADVLPFLGNIFTDLLIMADCR